MTTNALPPTECQILQFKHLFKLRTGYDNSKSIYSKPTHLIAVSSEFGLTFVGEKNNLKVVANDKLFQNNCHFDSKTVIREYLHKNIPLPSSPSHIDINSEQKLLAVTYRAQNVPVLRVFVIETICAQNTSFYPEVRLSSTSGTHVTDLSWNPGIPNILACCISDGTLSTYTFNAMGHFEIKSLPRESNSLCICWSPKGKQIAVGNYNGFLTQYVPDLKAVKNFPPPSGLFAKTCTLCSIKWLSNFQFIGVYKTQEENLTDDEEIKSCVVVINTPKNGPISYINYDDICFSSGIERPVQFYFTHIPSWNLIFVSSSNSVEVAVLNMDKDGITWILWNLEPEESRITLPIIKSGEAFPVGVAIDYVSRFQMSFGDRIISMPILSIMTWEGLICVYLVNYLNHAVPDVCTKTSVSLPLHYFTMELINDEEPTYSQPTVVEEVPEVSLNQFTPTPPHVSGYNYTIVQPSYPSENVSVSSTLNGMTSILGEMPKIAPSFTDSNSSYTFETSVTKTMTPEPVPVDATPKIQNQPQHTPNVKEQKNLNKMSPSNIKIGNVIIKSEPSKSPQEILKKFKKRASVFENDIQEIKYLVNNIKIDEGKMPNQRREISSKLNTESKKLKEYNVKLRNDIDVLKTSLIEAFAWVQDIKSKLFQIKNPKYQSLSGIQDMDPISQNNLKNIENTINYIQIQVEKANKQLEESWYKFTENTKTPTTKVPLLENIYETMVKQQKILNFLRLQTEKLQKKIAAIIQRLSKNNSSFSGDKLDSSLPWSSDRLLNESMSLDDLTKQALNLSTSDELQPKILAQKLSRDYAKRFHLSYAKQVKLQELLSTGSVTYVQSSRLQRLKKKSLIILSKNSYVPEPAEEEINEATTPVENIRTNMISPVSSDDDVRPTQVESIISSTPLKNTTPSKFTMEKLLPTVPSVTKQATTTLGKSAFSIPSSISLIPVTSEEKIDSKISEPVPVLGFRQISKVEQTSNDSKTAVSPSISTTSQFLQLSLSSVTTATPITCTGSFPGTVKPMTTTQAGSIFSNFSGTSLFSINPVASSVNIACSSVKTTTISPSALSFAGVETTTESTTPSSSLSSGSLFGIKPTFGVSSMATVTSSSRAIEGSLFKSFSNTGSLPSFGYLAATSQAESAPVTSLSISGKGPTALLATSTISPVVTSMRTTCNSATPAFSKPNTSDAIHFGSALSSHSSFAGNPTTVTASFTITATSQKDVSLNKFSFANADTSAPADTVTITEVTSETDSTETKENENNIISTTTPFSFASLGTLSSTPTKSEASDDVTTVSSTVVTLPLITAVTSSIFSTHPNVTPKTSSVPVTVVASTSSAETILSQPATVSTSTSANETGFDNAGSFFGNLNLGLSPAATTSNSIFGSSLSSAPSLFGGTSGGNIFSHTPNTYVGANESKPLFGSSTSTLLFGGSNVTTTETKNIFGSSSNFQSGTSLFGGTSSSAPLFGSSSTFGRGSANQGNAFGTSTSGGSLFSNAGSGFASPFQNTAGGFGSPPSFGSSLQQQQPANTGGFGSPPSFSTFGGTPTFGGSPSFGSSPTKVFGQTSTNMGTFGGGASQTATGFENLANNENTVTFGNLAQQQTPSARFGSPPTFNSSNAGSAFGSPKFGGGNFSSWR